MKSTTRFETVCKMLNKPLSYSKIILFVPAFTSTALKTLFALKTSTSESSIGGKLLNRPLSFSIVVVTKKKISNKKAMSAIDPAFTSGAALFAIFYYLLITFLTPEKIIVNAATTINI